MNPERQEEVSPGTAPGAPDPAVGSRPTGDPAPLAAAPDVPDATGLTVVGDAASDVASDAAPDVASEVALSNVAASDVAARDAADVAAADVAAADAVDTAISDAVGPDTAAADAADSNTAGSDTVDPDPVVAGPDIATLAAPLRTRLAEVCADAVGALPAAELPQPLRPIARFTPAKRARAGEAVLLGAFAGNAAFRTQVREWITRRRPELLRMPGDDPVTAATAAILDGHPTAGHLAELVALRTAESAARTERDNAVAAAERLGRELEIARSKVAGADTDADRRAAETRAEADRLRGRLREQGTRLRVARDEADAANAALAALRAETELEVKRVEAERDAERTRAETERDRARAAEQAATIARQSAKEARRADETRLALLVETIEGAAAGLRGELSLGSGTGVRPADTLGRANNAAVSSRMVRDTSALDALLRLPAAHLIVDGYNVTKTGYPELSLADQRDRLARQLAALAARTHAEVTVIFDGAGVVAHTTWPRGVRVQFSAPGVLADDVIRDLVAVEPSGRPVVVATSDNAVVESVRADGAHAVPSAVLVKRLMRI